MTEAEREAFVEAMASRLAFLEERAERAERQRDAWKAETLSAREALRRMLAAEPRRAVAAAERLAFLGGRIEALGTLAIELGPQGGPAATAYVEAWDAFAAAAADLVRG